MRITGDKNDSIRKFKINTTYNVSKRFHTVNYFYELRIFRDKRNYIYQVSLKLTDNYIYLKETDIDDTRYNHHPDIKGPSRGAISLLLSKH